MSNNSGVLRDSNKLSYCVTSDSTLERDEEKMRGLVLCLEKLIYFCRVCCQNGRLKNLVSHLRSKSHKMNGKAFLVCFGDRAIVDESIEVRAHHVY